MINDNENFHLFDEKRTMEDGNRFSNWRFKIFLEKNISVLCKEYFAHIEGNLNERRDVYVI